MHESIRWPKNGNNKNLELIETFYIVQYKNADCVDTQLMQNEFIYYLFESFSFRCDIASDIFSFPKIIKMLLVLLNRNYMK